MSVPCIPDHRYHLGVLRAVQFRDPKTFDRLKASPQSLGIHDIIKIQFMDQFKHTFDILVIDTGKCLIQRNDPGVIFIIRLLYCAFTAPNSGTYIAIAFHLH